MSVYSACSASGWLSCLGDQVCDSLSTESKADFRFLSIVDRPGVSATLFKTSRLQQLGLDARQKNGSKHLLRTESREILLYFLHSLRLPLPLYDGRIKPFLQSGGICLVSQAPTCCFATTTYYYVLFHWRCMYVWYVLLNSNHLLSYLPSVQSRFLLV